MITDNDTPGIMIIKGSIVTPNPIKTVIKYDIP